jgi:hypothetical protein
MVNRFTRILIPTPLQLLASALIAIAIVINVYQSVIVPGLYDLLFVNSSDVGQAVKNGLSSLNQYAVARNSVQVLFWAMVGIACYVVYLAVTNAIIDARNQVVIETEYANKGRLADTIWPALRQLAVAAGLFLYLFAAGRLLLPLEFQAIDPLVFTGFDAASVALALAGWLGMVATIYVAWIFIEFVFVADQPG